MGARSVFVLAGTMAGTIACFPDPEGDFKAYEDRANAFATPSDAGGGTFEPSPPPTEPVEGVYYGACLSQLAFGQVKKVFSFYTEVKFAPGRLSLTLQALKLGPEQGPPPNVSKAGVSGEEKDAPASNVASDARFKIDLGTMTVPGDANPITGRDVVIESTALTGFFGQKTFCARLVGNVTQPIELALDPPRNICKFLPLKDGDATPAFRPEDFEPGACPY
jgi:hypothetical protein